MKYYNKISLIIVLLLSSACGQDINDNFSSVSHDIISVDSKKVLSCPESIKDPDKSLLDVNNATGSPYEDLDREIKDLSTSIVVNQFFLSPDTLFRFMKLVYSTIDEGLKTYKNDHALEEKAISVIFKGGNILRIIAHQLFSHLPYDSRSILQAHYDDFFKRSDIDFSIIINEAKLKELAYDEVLKDITAITYNALNEIRSELVARPEIYFNLFQLKSKIIRENFKLYLDKFNLMESIKDIENTHWNQAKFLELQFLNDHANQDMICKYEGKYDNRFDFTQGKKSILGRSISKTPHWIMNSINTTLGWPFENDATKLIHFYLVRSKVQFEVVYADKDHKLARKPIGGELIDVSIPLKDDDNLKEIIKHYDAWISNYNFSLDNTEDNLNLKGESITGLAEDITGIIFHQYDRPWEANKYEKRLYRLFFLSIVEMLGQNNHSNENLLDYIATVKDIINQSKPSSAIDELINKHSSLSINNQLYAGIIKVINNIAISSKEDDEKNLQAMLDIINKNIEVIEQFLAMKPQHIAYEKLYNAKMSSFF